MASCITSQWTNTSPPQVQLVVEGVSNKSTETQAVLKWTLYYIATTAANTSLKRAWSVTVAGQTIKSTSATEFAIGGKTGTHTVASGEVTVDRGTSAKTVAFSLSFNMALTWSGSYKGTVTANGSMSVAAKTSYAVKYNANGGSGAPSAQTKWHGTALTLSSTKPTRSGYTFQGWATSASGAVVYSTAKGMSYTANAAVTLYAVWEANTYTVTYNANGGSGAPSAQTKKHGTALTLTTAKPTKTNYNFKGWATSANSTTVKYAVGASYTADASITLYAVWELAYTKPRISGLSVTRCNSDGTANDEGTSARVKFSWACDKDVTEIKISWFATSVSGAASTIITASGKSGSVNTIISTLSSDITYMVSVDVRDSVDSSQGSAVLGSKKFPIDADGANRSIAFYKAAERANAIEFGEKAYDKHDTAITNGLAEYTGSGDAAIDPDTTLEHLVLTNKNTPVSGRFFYIATNFYSNKATNKNRMQVAFPYNADDGIYHRYNSGGAWSNWMEGVCKIGGVVNITSHRFANGWIGFYPTAADAKAHSNRLGWMGYDGGDSMTITDAGGGGMALKSSGSIRVYGSNSSNGTATLSDRFRATANDVLYLGDASNKWKAVYAVNGTIQTSDRNHKKNIEGIDQRYIDLFDRLQPVSFMFNDPESDRVHIGFIAQDVQAAMDEVGLTDLDFAGFCRDAAVVYDENDVPHEVLDDDGNPVYIYSLRYSEFIALNSRMIQINRARIAEQQAEINALRNVVEELKQAVAQLASDL